MSTITLNNGLTMPQLGLGTWKSKPGEVRAAVLHAIRHGYRHIDAAWCYRNQDEVGAGIREAIQEGIVTREELWVTTKLWNPFHAADAVEPHLRDSLQQLNLDYVDLYLIHWPVSDIESEVLTPSYEETWKAMEALVVKGLTKAIGVSNLGPQKLLAMKEYATIFPAVNQVELHPMWRNEPLLEVCAELGVHLTAYSPLGSPDSAEMLNRVNGPLLMENPLVVSIAEQTSRSPGQVLIKWGLQRGTSVIPKSVTPSRIEENFDMFSWSLSDEQMAQLNSISPQERMLHGAFYVKENGPYKVVEDLWA
jgi:alcohol dehydrogenase (NADP+)